MHSAFGVFAYDVNLGDNIILDKSFTFTIRVVKLYKHLCDDKKEYVLSKQLLRSGTSVGVNINEAQTGQSKKDFIAKVSIASKEARESRYWIKLTYKNRLSRYKRKSCTIFTKRDRRNY